MAVRLRCGRRPGERQSVLAGDECRANEVEPYAYLNYLFERLPAASTVTQVEALLPWNVKVVLEEQKKKMQERSQPAAA